MKDIGGIQQVETDGDVPVYEITDSDEFEATGGIKPKARPTNPARVGRGSISPSDEDEEE
jgi:hypothetical protein